MTLSRHNVQDVSISLICFLVALTVMLCARDLGGVNISKYIILGGIMAYSVFSKPQNIIYLLCFLFPISGGIPGNYIYPLLAVLLATKGVVKNKWQITFWFAVCFSELMHFAFYDFVIDWPDTIGYISILFLTTSIIADDDTRVDKSLCALFYVLGITLLIVVIIINSVSSIGFQEMLMDEMRFGDVKKYGDMAQDVMVISTNANNLAYFSIVSIASVGVLWYMKRLHLFIAIPLLLIALYGGILSFSRTWMMLLVLLALLFYIFREGHYIKGLGVMVIVVSVVLAIFMNTGEFMSTFQDRFQDDNLSTAGNRTVLFKAYNDFMMSNNTAFWVGTGAMHYKDITHIEIGTHNAIQQIFVSYGLIGLLLFAFVFYAACRFFGRGSQRMQYIPLIGAFLFLQSIQFLNPSFLMTGMIPSFAILSIRNTKL